MSSFGRPKTRKRGGVRHRKSTTPKKKAKKKKVCKRGRNHKAVRSRHWVPAGQLCLKGFKSWLTARKVRNRLAHALNGNYFARLIPLLALPLMPLVSRTEQELEQTIAVVLDSAAVATSEVVSELGSSGRLHGGPRFVPGAPGCFPDGGLGSDEDLEEPPHAHAEREHRSVPISRT